MLAIFVPSLLDNLLCLSVFEISQENLFKAQKNQIVQILAFIEKQIYVIILVVIEFYY